MKPCISEATTLPCSFAEDVKAYASAESRGMEVWLTKLETHLENNSVGDTLNLLQDHHMQLAAASYQGGLLLSQGDQRRAHYDHFRRRLDLCQRFGIATLSVVADFTEAIDQTVLERAVVSLKQAGQWAAGFGVRLALEFRSRGTFCTSLDTAIALVNQAAEPNIGVNFDLFHYYTGPSKFEDLSLLNSQNLAFVQLSDLAGLPRELATDADRVMPGDGNFQIKPIIERLQEIGYEGWVSLELFNPTLWKSKASQVAELGKMALCRVLETEAVG
jgi:sugar phosphate isomerase/epimerase